MQLGDEVKVATFSHEETGLAFSHGLPIEVGGRGRVVQIWAIHHHLSNFDTTIAFAQYGSGLSENPEHHANPPVSVAALAQSKAVYGRIVWNTGWAGPGGSFDVATWVIPTYGIIRPRRQIWVSVGIQGEINDFLPAIEIYYTPIDDLPRQVVNSINRARGKYRRS